MKTIFSSEGMRPTVAFECWMDVATSRFRHQSEPFDRHRFYADLKIGALDDVSVWQWSVAPRKSRYTEDNDPMLMFPLRRLCFETKNCSCVTDDGQLYLLDTREPTIIQSSEPIACLALLIPRNALGERIPLIGKTVNQPIPIQGDAALLAELLRSLTRIGPSNLSPDNAPRFRDYMLDLSALVLGHFAGCPAKLGSATRLAVLKIRAAIENQLTDPAANPDSIAAAAGMSVRHASRILAQTGITSIRRLLIQRRLTKCREALEDPQDARTIDNIAYGTGFSDITHFRHAFKKRYGISPGDCRFGKSR